MSNKKKLELKNVLKVIIDYPDLVYIEDVCAEIPVSISSFYDYYPSDSEGMAEIKDLLGRNKVAIKRRLRTKWAISDNATTSISLYKLLGTKEEKDALNNNKTIVVNAEQAPQLEMLDNAYNEED